MGIWRQFACEDMEVLQAQRAQSTCRDDIQLHAKNEHKTYTWCWALEGRGETSTT